MHGENTMTKTTKLWLGIACRSASIRMEITVLLILGRKMLKLILQSVLSAKSAEVQCSSSFLVETKYSLCGNTGCVWSNGSVDQVR